MSYVLGFQSLQWITPMNSKESRFKLFDDIKGRPVTADNNANPVSSNGVLAIAVAIEKKIWDC